MERTYKFNNVPVARHGVDSQKMKQEIYNLDIFKSEGDALYVYEADTRIWRRIPIQQESLEIRKLYKEEDQSYLDDALLKRIALWLKKHPDLQVNFEEKRNKYLVCMENGVLDIRNYQFREVAKEDYCTYVLNAKWLPKADQQEDNCFNSFCERVFAKDKAEEKKRMLEVMLGYIFSNLCDAKKALFLIGPTSCGKSVILRFIGAVLGDENYSRVGMEQLGERFSKAELQGKIANIAGEISAGKISHKSFDNFKSIVGRDSIQAERKGKDPFNFTFKGKLVFAGNLLPEFSVMDGSEAFIERIALLVFNNTIDKRFQDKNIDEKLFETHYILALRFLLRMKEFISSGYNFGMGEDEERMIKQYRESANSVSVFVEAECEIVAEKDCYTVISELYDAYIKFTDSMAVEAEKKSVFRKKLLAVNDKIKLAGKHRVNGGSPRACFSGIRLKEYDIKQDTEIGDKG